MNLIKNINQLSFGKVLSLAVVLAVVLAVPVGVILVQQQTRINSRAAYEKPTLSTQPKATPGPIPAQAPEIGRIFPWVGKEGDVIWLQGKNFGTNPIVKKLTIGGIEIEDIAIDSWENDQIQATIPVGAKQGGVAEIKIGDYPEVQSLPYVLYDQSTITKLRKEGNIINLEKGSQVAKAIVWTGDDEIPTQKHEIVIVPQEDLTKVFDTEGLPILSIVLLDAQGKLVPYYVDPIEFDF